MRAGLGAAAAALLLLFAALGAQAQQQPRQPVLITAEAIEHDQETNIVTAVGRVELDNGTQILQADRVAWDPRSDTVRAMGNIALVQPTGEVLFADEVELTDEFRNGFVSGIRVLLADQSRLAAASAVRQGGTYTEMYNALFTSCSTCMGDRDPPVWQLRASKVTHDQVAHTVRYEHARLEFFGIPLLYTPFFTHPDPTIQRKSGLLAPTYGSTNALGATIETPYYLNLAPSRDATLTPFFTAKEGMVMKGEYRQLTPNGLFETRGSITRPWARDDDNLRLNERDTRGHVETSGLWTLSPDWRWGFTGSRSSDDTYLRRYEISDANVLTTNAFVEGMRDRNYAAVNAWSFQGLRQDDDPGQSPTVLPMMEYSRYSPTGRYGQYAVVDANVLAIHRSEGRNVMRLSSRAEWRLPYTSRFGEVYSMSASVRADGYAVDGQRETTAVPDQTVDGFKGRVLPRLALEWRFPLVRAGTNSDYMIEPIVEGIVAPYGGNPPLIPNEDSLAFEYDDTNLFGPSRFPGLDRWEGGPRINYGVRFGTYSARTAAHAMIGQTARARDDTFPAGSGLEKSPSDYVGRISVQWPTVDLEQRFRLDRESFSLRRNEVDLGFGPDDAKFTAGYVFLSEKIDPLDGPDGPEARREELNLTARVKLTQTWSINARSRHDLRENGGLMLAGLGLVYDCDCMRVGLELTRRLTEDRDVPRSTAISLRVNLRHLG